MVTLCYNPMRGLFFISAICIFTLCVAPLPKRKQSKTLSTVSVYDYRFTTPMMTVQIPCKISLDYINTVQTVKAFFCGVSIPSHGHNYNCSIFILCGNQITMQIHMSMTSTYEMTDYSIASTKISVIIECVNCVLGYFSHVID